MDCGLCSEGDGTKFDDFESFRAHLTEAHTANAVDVFACDECEQAFRSKKTYCVHRRVHDPTTPISKEFQTQHGLACTDCGLYLRITEEESAEEWTAFCRIMATHSPSHLVLVRVHSVSTLKAQPKIKVNLPIKFASGTSAEQICPHCKVEFKGRTAMKKHLLAGNCIPRLPATALALLVRPENGKERVDKKRKLAKRILKKEGKREDDKRLFGNLNFKIGQGNLQGTAIKVKEKEGTCLLIPATIPIFRSATDITIAYTPKGAVKALYCCNSCKMLVGLGAGNNHTFNGKFCQLTQLHGRIPPNAPIPCKDCEYSVCSVLGLQAHRSLAHDQDLTIHPDMEKERTEGMTSSGADRLLSPSRGQEARRRQESSSSAGETPRAPGQARQESSRKRQASSSSSTGQENTAPAPPKQRKEMLRTDPRSGVPVYAVPDTATPPAALEPNENLVPLMHVKMIASTVSATRAGSSRSAEPSGAGKTSSELKPEEEKKAEGVEGSSALNVNGETKESEERPGASAEESRPKMSLLECYTKPAASSYLPKDGFFRLCRQCMTAMPEDEETWRAHMEKHKDEWTHKRYSCVDCSLMLTKKELAHHNKEHILTCIQCTPCKKSFADDVIYFLHLAETHSVDLVHFCKKCSIATKSAEQLREHIHSQACGKAANKTALEPAPGVIGECVVSFEGGLEPGCAFAPHSSQHYDRPSMRCKLPCCARRTLTLPSEKAAQGLEDVAGLALRARINCRASCPVDLFPITHCSYCYSEHEKSHPLLQNSPEQIKDFVEQQREVREGRCGISGIPSLASYMRLPLRSRRTSKSSSRAGSSAGASDAPTQNGVEPAAEVEETIQNGATASSETEPSTSTSDAAPKSTRKWSEAEIKEREEKRNECRRRYKTVFARIAENFCKTGTAFAYTAEQKRATRLDMPVTYEATDPVKCVVCLSKRAYYTIPEGKQEDWVNHYSSTTNKESSDSLYHYLRTTFIPGSRFCARHFEPSDIDQEGRLAHATLPFYLERMCIVCDNKMLGDEVPIFNKEQLQALADVPFCKDSFDELLTQCNKDVHYACPTCIALAWEVHPDTVPAAVRDEIAREMALKAEKAKGKKKANGSTPVPSSSKPSTSNSPGPYVPASEPTIAEDLVSAMNDAVTEPPTPMPPPSTSARGDADDDDLGDVREPPTPQTQGLRQTLNSALHDAVLEPPTPAAPPPQSSTAGGNVGSDDEEEHLATVKRALSKDYVPPTPRAQEHVAEIARDMLIDAPSTSMAPPRVPPAAAQQQPSTSTASTSASTSAAPSQPSQLQQLQHVVTQLPILHQRQQQPAQQQQQRQSVVQPLPVQNQPVQMPLPNPPAQAVPLTQQHLQQLQQMHQMLQQQAPLNAQQQILQQTHQRQTLIKNQKERINKQIQALNPFHPSELQQWTRMLQQHTSEINEIVMRHGMAVRMLDIVKQKEIEEKQAAHNHQKLQLLHHLTQQRAMLLQQQQQAQQQHQAQQQQAQQQLMHQQRQQQLQMQQQQQQQQRPQQVVNPMLHPQQPDIQQMQQQVLMMMQGGAQTAQHQSPPAAQRPGPSNAVPAAVLAQQQQHQLLQQQQQQQPANGAPPEKDVMIHRIKFWMTLNPGQVPDLARYENDLRCMDEPQLRIEYESHRRMNDRILQQPGPSTSQSRPQQQQQQPGPSNGQPRTVAETFGGWEEPRTGETFQCHLCTPKMKDASTPRVRPKTKDVELMLDALKIEKGSLRRRILFRHWNRSMDRVLICKAHVVEEMDKGLTCNNCRDYCVAEERDLHKAKFPFYCMECCKEMNCTEHDILGHMHGAHKMKFPANPVRRLHCPLRGDPNYNCNHISESMKGYTDHLRDAHSNEYPVSAPNDSNHKCELIFKTQADLDFHEQRVADQKRSFGRGSECKPPCCPLCGSIYLWEGTIGHDAELVKVFHETMHMLDWTPVCKHDLQQTLRGKEATRHFKAYHYDSQCDEEPCALCPPPANPRDFNIKAHADSHVIIGLSIPKEHVIHADDNSRALLGLGGDDVEEID